MDEQSCQIMVYGLEKKGLSSPKEVISSSGFRLHFEPFDTDKRFTDFDGVILFQGIFEEKQTSTPVYYGSSKMAINSDRKELDKRDKEVSLLLQNGGFICFVLTKKFIDRDDYGDTSSTDLSKRYLNMRDFYREYLGDRYTHLHCVRNEFTHFLSLYGAACTHFYKYRNDIEWTVMCKVGSHVTGMILFDNCFFVPTLIPESHQVKDYFIKLAEALLSTRNKLLLELPEWVVEFQFSEEVILTRRQGKVTKLLDSIHEKLNSISQNKRCLIADGDSLVDSVSDIFRVGFGFAIDNSDEYREDIKIVNDENEPIVFCEVKGTNAGVKREFVNQADSHRERANLPPDFPALLIINTHIKHSHSLDDKDKEVPIDQTKHANKINVLILRTLDLLRLLKLFRDGSITKKEVLDLISNNSGWLKVSNDSWEIVIC